MATQISIKKGESNPTNLSGLTLAEPVFVSTNNTLWIGKGSGVTPVWVGAGICGASSGIAAGLTYQIPTLAAVKNYIGGLCYGNTAGGGTSITQYVSSFNGNTGAVTGASLGANTFTGLNSFNAGISSFGGTFSGNIVQFLSGLSASLVRIGSLESNGSNPVTLSEYRLRFTVVGFPTSSYTTLQADPTTSADRTVTLPDASGTVALTSQLMGAVNGSTAATTAVTSFNGLTGSVGGVCAAQANTFTALQSFASGISASGITVGGSMTVTGNLTVSGGVTFTISENVLIEDNIITLNSNVTGSPSENAGIEIERGTSANVQLLWNESSDKWTFTNDGSTYYDLPTSVVSSFNGLTGAVQGVSAAIAGTGISVSGATGAVTITNIGVQSFNGATGAVTGASLGANTFTGTQTLNAGLTTSYLYASTGSTFGSTLQVNGGATFSGRVDVGGNFKVLGDTQLGDASTDTLNVYSGTTFQNRTDFGGSNNFNSGLTAAGNINLSGTRSITGKGASLTIKGISTGASPVASNSIVLSGQVTTNLSLNSATGIVDIQKGQETVLGPYIGGLKIKSDDTDTLSGSSTITPQTYLSADRFLYVPDDTGTIALTKNVVSSFNGATGAVTGASLGANTFTALNTFNAGISAAGGVTLAGTLQGTTASFTGLVSSTVGFSGSATNLVGNANGLTAGTASRVQIAEGAGSSYYLALAGGTGNTGIFVDTSTPRWTYNASTGSLITTTGYVEAANLRATTAIYSNIFSGNDGTSQLNIVAPYFDGTNQPIYIGDTDGSQNGTLITIDDNLTKIELAANYIDAFGDLNIRNSGYLTFYDADSSNYVAFRGATTIAANTTWILPSADGSANQVLTTNGSGTLSWSTPSGGSSVTSFNGLTGAVTGASLGANTFTALNTFNAGISASGATLSSNTTIPSGSTLTVNGNFVANGNVNLGDAVTDAITVTGVLAANGGLSAAGGTFSALTRFTAGISAAGGVTLAGTFSGTTGSFSKLLSLSGGLSAAGGITFSAPISSTRMARHTSAAISAEKTADFSPTAAEDGTVFYINYGGKGSITVTLEGLPVGWRAKFFNIGGGMVFFTSTTGAVSGYGAANGLGDFILEAICFSADNYIVG